MQSFEPSRWPVSQNLELPVAFKQACMHPYAQATEWNLYMRSYVYCIYKYIFQQ